MVTIVKHEWHQVDSKYVYELDIEKLGEIYPDLSKKELKQKMKDIVSGEVDIDEVITEAEDNNVDIDWEHDDDDWWTSRKGGFEVTFDVVDRE